MRIAAAASLIGLSFLSGCAPPQNLMSEAPTLRDVPARYTDNPAHAATTRVVNLTVDQNFSAAERADIMGAVREWNHVLNGAVRLDVVPRPVPGRSWMLVSSHQPLDLKRGNSPQPLTLNQRIGPDSGIIIVYVSRIDDPDLRDARQHDLRSLVTHALGMALGGGNGSTLYTAHVEDCISRSTAMSVGAVQEIPAAQLNWCQPAAGTTVAAR